MCGTFFANNTLKAHCFMFYHMKLWAAMQVTGSDQPHVFVKSEKAKIKKLLENNLLWNSKK